MALPKGRILFYANGQHGILRALRFSSRRKLDSIAPLECHVPQVLHAPGAEPGLVSEQVGADALEPELLLELLDELLLVVGVAWANKAKIEKLLVVQVTVLFPVLTTQLLSKFQVLPS